LSVRLRLKEILDEKGISQRQLAIMMDIRPNTISHLCSDRINAVYFDTLDQLCKTLNVELHELIIRED
jgi:putative transcriptional regulator